MQTLDENDKINYRNFYRLKKINKYADKYIQEYRRFQTKPEYGKKYIYFPLHYQPECNTSPVGGYFADQILAVKIF